MSIKINNMACVRVQEYIQREMSYERSQRPEEGSMILLDISDHKDLKINGYEGLT